MKSGATARAASAWELRLSDLVIWLAFCLEAIFLALIRKDANQAFDIHGLWLATRAALYGRNPYDFVEFQQFAAATETSVGSVWPIFNPPWTFVFLLPVAPLGFSSAVALWGLISSICAAVSGFLLFKALAPHQRAKDLALFLLVFTSFAPFYAHLKLGQVSILVLLGLSLLISRTRGSSRRNEFLSGTAATLLLIKPQLAFVALILEITDSLYRQRWSFVKGFCCAFLLLLALVVLLNARLLSEYLGSLGVPRYWRTFIAGALLPSISDNLLPPLKATLAFSGAALGIAVYWRRRSISKELLLGFALPVSVLTAPHLHPYDMVCLFPTVAWIVLHEAGTKKIPFLSLVTVSFQALLCGTGMRYEFAYLYAAFVALSAWHLYCRLLIASRTD